MKSSIQRIVRGILLLLALSTAGFSQSQNPKLYVGPSDFVMPQEKASKFSQEIISPILFEFSNSDSAPKPLCDRVRKIVELINRREIDYYALPAYFPNRKLTVLAKVEQLGPRWALFLFIPAVMEWRDKLSETDFRYSMAITFAHEMIHLELAKDRPVRSDKQAVQDEAVAWGKTVLEIIRPLEAELSITVSYYALLSQDLKSLKDDYSDGRWIRKFAPEMI